MFVIGALVSRFFAAKLMEKIGKKNLLLAGALLEVISSIMYFGAVDILVLFMIRFLHGASYGMASTSVSTIVTEIVPKERHGEGIGYFMLSVTLGAAVGPFFGMFLTEHGGFPMIFLACTAAAVLCFIGVFILDTSCFDPAPARGKNHDTGAGRQKGFFETGAIPISLLCAGVYFCYSGVISFLTPYSNEIHLETAATLFFVIYSAAIFFSRPFTGRLFDRKGDRFVMIPAFFSFFTGMFILSQVNTGMILLLSAAFIGLGIGTIQSCGLAIAVKRSGN